MWHTLAIGLSLRKCWPQPVNGTTANTVRNKTTCMMENNGDQIEDSKCDRVLKSHCYGYCDRLLASKSRKRH